jgi:hypothetical protein
MNIFIVTIGGFPEIYKKLEIKNSEFYGDDKLICDIIYIQKIICTTTDKINEL